VYTRLGGIRSGEREHLEDPVVDGRKILKLIFKKWDEAF
jgi:hypothetical protein